MFQVDVPFSMHLLNDNTADYYLKALKDVGATRVWMCGDPPKTQEEKKAFATKKKLLEENGFDTGVWISSIYHIHYDEPYTRMVTVDGKKCDAIVCPTDAQFIKDYIENWLKPAVETGAPTVMFDDDFRMNFNDHGPLCFCDTHMARYSQIIGRPVTREEMRANLLSGQPNEYRDAWLQECRRTLLDFAKALRAAADEINPDCRLCICSGPAQWGVDGAASPDGELAVEIVQILAGKQKPHMRLNGCPMYMSPYFQSIFKNKTFAQAIEFDRMQAYHCSKFDMTVCSENDSYPRPRYVIAAAYLDMFEMICRADGHFTGTQKYMLDYVMEPSYETGYIDAATENQPIFQAITQEFADKKLTGITVFCPMDNLRYRTFQTDGCDTDLEVEATNVPGQRYLVDNSIPVVYEGDGPVVIFGSYAEQADEALLKKGAIIDLEAAEILTRRGFDVGLVSVGGSVQGKIVGDIELSHNNFEHYLPEDSMVPLKTPIIRPAVVSEKAKLLSTMVIGDRTSPGSYLYENDKGLKFYVLAFDAYVNMFNDGVFRSYHRQKHLVQAHEWLTGRKLDAVCLKNPDLYMITKKNDKELAVGLWNFSPDAVFKPVVELGETYAKVRGINCEARLEGNKVYLSKLHAYEFAGFVVEK